MIVKHSRLDKDLEKGLYLDFKLEVEDTENDKKIEIVDEDGTAIYGSNYVKTGDILYDTAYIDKDYFKSSKTTFTLRSTDSSNYVTTLSQTITVDSYKISIDNIEIKPVIDVNDNIILYKTYIRWTYYNFSLEDLYVKALLYPIKDDDRDVSYDTLPSAYTDARYIKSNDTVVKAKAISLQTVTSMDVTPATLFSGNAAELKTSIVLYRLVVRAINNKTHEEIISFFPAQGAFRYKASNVNKAPIIKLDNIQVTPRENSFQLNMQSILRDDNLDDVRYTINDNQGNSIYQKDYYSYTPRIDRIIFNYDNYSFNSLFLKLNAEIGDNLNFITKKSFSYPLFTVTNLRIRRNRILWDIKNYSNSILKTNVQILDLKGNIIYEGPAIANRLEKVDITVKDESDLLYSLLQNTDDYDFYNFYKLRIKITGDDANYTGYEEFENGTLVSTQHHNPADIIIYKNIYPNDYYDDAFKGKVLEHLSRDAENNKRIRMIFDINPANDSAIGDYCTYTVADDSGNTIYISKDTITIPQRVEINLPYDFTQHLYNNITVNVKTEFGSISQSTIEIPSYYIRDHSIMPGSQKLSLLADNYYVKPIQIIVEVHDMYNGERERKDVSEIGVSTRILKEELLLLSNSDVSIQKYIRVTPKIYYDIDGNIYKPDALKCRIRVQEYIDPVDTTTEYVDDGIYYTDRFIPVDGYLHPMLNNKPSIAINYASNVINPDTNVMTSLVNITFGDGDGDCITFNVNDRYGVLAAADLFETGLDNTFNLTVTKTYDLNTIDSSMVQWNITCFDQEGLYDSLVHRIPLYYISNLVFESHNMQYKCKLYSKKTITTLLEILDDEGYLYATTKEIPVVYSTDTKVIEGALSIKKFIPGNYRYRIKVTSSNENWSIYYPNMSGELIYISQEMIDADRAVTNTMTAADIQAVVYTQLTELTTILAQKIEIGSYTAEQNTILGRLYDLLLALPIVSDKSSMIIELLDIFSNQQDTLLTIFNGVYGDHLLTSRSVTDDGVIIDENRGFTNYAMNINAYVYNLDGYPLEFLIDENYHLPFEKYQTRTFVNGKKVLDHKTNSQILNDGLTKSYVGNNSIPKFSIVETQTIKNLLDNVENEIITIPIVTVDDILTLQNKGMTLNIANYYLDHKLDLYILRTDSFQQKNRVNLFRYSIKKEASILIINIKDSLYVGDEIKVVTNSIYERQYLNTSQITGGASNASSSTKPVYFIPINFLDSAGNHIDGNDPEIVNKLEIYINGYLAIPTDDYIVVPQNMQLSLPPIVLFKDLLFGNSDIEMYYNNDILAGSNIYVEQLLVSDNYYYMQSTVQYPLIKGMFSVYSDNKKIPDEDILVLNKNYLVFKKNVYTTKNNEHYFLKIHNSKNPIVSQLLELYATYPPTKDVSTLSTLISEIPDKSQLLSPTSNYGADNDYLVFLKYIYELDNDKFAFIKEMKTLLSGELSELEVNGIDCSINYFNANDVINFSLTDNLLSCPTYFNHEINIFAGSNLFKGKNFDNLISIYNPSRLLQLSEYLELSDQEIDCSVQIDSNQYDVFLNEGIDIEMNYIVSDIEVERNLF